jgi:predicted metal-dependent hydrolase
MAEMKEISYGTSIINCTISYSNRRTLGITVHPDSRVTIDAPFDASTEQIEKKILKRASWILNRQNYFKSFGERTSPRRYISGESHLYLGKQYVLHVAEGKSNCVHFKGRSFEIVCTTKSKAERLMKEWYKEKAKIKFAEIAEPIILRFRKYKVEPTALYIQVMENRWGSCTPKGKIILNTELIKAPKPCIEYVVTHELCHLLHRNHTKAFFKLLTSEMPDWEKWKRKLEKLQLMPGR